ncbi:helix-turn-helix domain-containing protein [Bacillus solitudinis]|uniref:helix-turn-helix domain-containing protein n=1 Tax=Bacillus solitudinis TaxID=2014074 RepID=UPI000C233A57|nr:helix-turn-helix transcriptional regulator [Bacillus solitudinis]
MSEINLEFIRSKRCNREISMQRMAEKLGFKNASTYLKYENGEYSLKANHLPIIADILSCDINDLFLVKKLLK